MRKWLKRIAIVLLALIVGVSVAAWAQYRRAQRVPAWYEQARSADTQDPDLENKTVVPLRNWVSKASSGNVAAKPSEAKRYTVELSADQLNALLAKWTDAAGISQGLARQMRQIRVRLADGRITIAGEAIEQQVVLSMVLEPRHDENGNARLALDKVRVGDAAVPLIAMGDLNGKLSGSLGRRVEAAREKVAIDEHGVATSDTATLYYANLAARLLSGQVVDAYAFVATGKGVVPNFDNPVATRIRDMKIDDNKLTLTLELLDAGQRQALVQELKAK